VDMKEVSCVFCMRDQVSFSCVWLSAYGAEEFQVDTNNKIMEELTSSGSFTLSQVDFRFGFGISLGICFGFGFGFVF
jgi:hypothetical protein